MKLEVDRRKGRKTVKIAKMSFILEIFGHFLYYLVAKLCCFFFSVKFESTVTEVKLGQYRVISIIVYYKFNRNSRNFKELRNSMLFIQWQVKNRYL